MKTFVVFLVGSVALMWLSSSAYAETIALTVDHAMTHQDAATLLAKRGHDKGHPGKGPGQKGKGQSEQVRQGQASEGEKEKEKNNEEGGREHGGPTATNGDEDDGGPADKGQKTHKHQDKKKGLDRADEAAGEHGEHGRAKARGQQ